ncbi:energy-coupling factor transporter transmembrane component T family protein [Catelliglobosispora koreensis]|uniref:energy-coupling factor transporter transmembrane component T family protein n=1 Tax=Catelliglobosispora koreensis TaxID=129052 RepID=UPI000368D8DF|nr:energy-coupling factor transporter transmembrane component T [Catelliglobosispora koreensis]
MTIAVLARRAPIAKVAALAILSVAALAVRDIAALGFIVVVTVALAPLFGIGPRALLRQAWPVLLAAVSIVLTLSLFSANRTGTTLLDFGPFLVTTSVLRDSTSLALRLLALALPALLVFASTDPTDLADSLIQHARVSPRFAIGALAAFRLTSLFRSEWGTIRAARRARGLRRAFLSTAFALLVGAIRRGVRLSVAMDARGFDAGHQRTIARPSPFGYADVLLMLAALALCAATFLIARR